MNTGFFSLTSILAMEATARNDDQLFYLAALIANENNT